MKLTRDQRMHLMQFVCTFAWTDLRISQEERDLVMRIAGRLDLDEVDVKKVNSWLKVPPPIDAVDPESIPASHRELFLALAEQVVRADGTVGEDEHQTLTVFRDLLRA